MKRTLAYLIFFSYTLLVFKPVVPVVSDFLAHTFWKLEHLATVHHHYGQDHVHHEMLETEKENRPDKAPVPLKAEDSVTLHLMAKVLFDFSMYLNLQNHYFTPQVYHSVVYLQQDDPPPKA